MNVNDKIRMMREMNNWTQEYVADKLHMSLTSYAKLERGESRLHLDKLTKIAEVFQVNIADLLSLDKQGLIWLISGDGSGNYSNLNYYNTHNERDFQIEKLTLQLQHKTEIIEQKDKLIEQLYAQISLLSK
ncbi:MAG: XRE family transcriptional regulator [Moraxella sp.]|nr:MAG: XRE family transcriptional regulator [Moraxella sp.]